nr:ribonuclease H-like domain-containing protein [Tanacetum cinerariifolium]
MDFAYSLILLSQDIKKLKFKIHCNEITIRELRKKLETVQREKDGIQLTIEKLENASKSLNKLIDSQIVDNCKKGLGYNAVLPPHTGLFMPLKPNLSYIILEEFTSEPAVETLNAKTSEDVPKVVKKDNGAPIIEDWKLDDEDKSVPQPKIEKRTVKPSVAKVNHKNFAKNTHPCLKRNIVPRAVLMKSGIKLVNVARYKAAVTVNTARLVNTALLKTTMNAANPRNFNLEETHKEELFTHKEEMDLETDQTTAIAKLHILKQDEYDMWRLRIEQYFQVQDYALWDVIKNGNSFKPVAQTTTNDASTSTTLIPGFITTEEMAQKKIVVKARSENISQEDLNLNFLRGLPSEWNTYVVVWRNKPDLDTMSFDDLYNNFKIVEQEVKGTANSSSSSNSQNMAFVSSPSSTNEVNNAYGVSTANSQANPASTQVNTASTQKVLDLEDELKRTKTAQQTKIDGLERRVKKLEKKQMSRTHKHKRLYKVGLTARVISSSDDEALDKEDTSKHGRIDEKDDDKYIARLEEVVEVVTTAKMIIDVVVDAAQVITVIADIPVSAAKTIVTTAPTITAESTKTNVKVTQAPKRKGVMIQEKFFAAKRDEEKRNKPHTKAQQRNIMSTYLKNIDGWKIISLKKKKSFAKIQELFDKAIKRINTFVDFRTELVEESTKKDKAETTQESSSKREGDKLKQERSKKKKVEND